jgi:hypothetical protein
MLRGKMQRQRSPRSQVGRAHSRVCFAQYWTQGIRTAYGVFSHASDSPSRLIFIGQCPGDSQKIRCNSFEAHTKAVLSDDAETMRTPSGRKAAHQTALSWPPRTLASFPGATSQTRAVPSSDTKCEHTQRTDTPGAFASDNNFDTGWIVGALYKRNNALY